MSNRNQKLKNVSLVGALINAIIAILKIIGGSISNSQAVIADGIDSTLDVANDFIMYFTANLLSRKPNKNFPYGYNKAENITANIITFIIFSVGFQLCVSNIESIIDGDYRKVIPTMIAIYVTVISILAKLFLTVWQMRIGKKMNSDMIMINAIHMRNDIFISITVLTSLGINLIYEMPIIDRIFAIALSIYIMWTALKLFKQNSIYLMDGVTEKDLYSKVIKAVDTVENVYNPHRIRIRKVGYKYIIDLDVEVDEKISVKNAHDMGILVEQAIKTNIPNVYDVMLHVEPLGNEEIEEYGVSNEIEP